jgi:hypothetical protein
MRLCGEIYKQIYSTMQRCNEPSGIILDRRTYRNLMRSRALLESGKVVPQHYSIDGNCTKIMGLMVSILDSNKEELFIKVVV